MSEGTSSGEENANLYARGVTEELDGRPLEGIALLAVLEVLRPSKRAAYRRARHPQPAAT